MNFSHDDIHRSLRRFVMNVVGSPPVTVRLERETIRDDERPACVVEPSSPVTALRGSRRTIPQGDVEQQGSFTITLYPALFDTAREGREEAQRLCSLMLDALQFGLTLSANAPADEHSLCPPETVPVYDYAGVPVEGPGRGGPPDPYGYAWVESWGGRTIQDPLDQLRWTVPIDVRLSWQRGGRVRSPGDEGELATGGLLPGAWTGG